MKVNTDSVLLGAWTKPAKPKHILDIGTGTGLLALMMAQKYAEAQITAIEINAEAYEQACENVALSKWHGRMKVIHTPLQTFVPAKTYDLIISNPPYFQNDLKNVAAAKSQARHNLSLSFEELLHSVQQLLHPNGVFYVVLPFTEGQIFRQQATTYALFCQHLTAIKPHPAKPANRLLMQFSKTPNSTLQQDELTIRIAGGSGYTKAYIALTRPFYLHF